MGFFEKIKKAIGKTLELEEGALGDNLITRMELKKPIKLGSSLNVKEGTMCVIGAATTMCEVLEPGEYELTGATIPKSFKVGKFCPTVKRGRGKLARTEIVKYFKPTIYFLNVNDFVIDFESGKFALADKLYGKPKINIKFNLKFYVSNAVDFVNALAIDWGYLKCNKVLSRLAAWFADDLITIINKQGYTVEELYREGEKTCELLLTALKKRFEGLGIEIKSLEISDVILPPEVVKEVAENTRTSKEIGEYSAKINGFEADAKFIQVNDTEINMSAPPIEIKSNDLGEPVIETKVCSKCGYETKENIKLCPMCATPFNQEQFITCPICGTNASIDAQVCFRCGEIFKKQNESKIVINTSDSEDNN